MAISRKRNYPVGFCNDDGLFACKEGTEISVSQSVNLIYIDNRTGNIARQSSDFRLSSFRKSRLRETRLKM